MIKSFKNITSENIFHGKDTKAARKLCPRNLWAVAVRKLDQLDSVVPLEELRVPPGNQLEALKGDRICFVWEDNQPCEVEVVDYHA
jgi:proteic killer suppression protein